MMSTIAIIIPIDLIRRASHLTSQILKIVRISNSINVKIFIGQAERGLSKEESLKKVLQRYANVVIVSQATNSEFPNLARLRNIAAEAASQDVLLFLDADIAPDIDLFKTLARQVMQGGALAMAPCIYLSEQGTRRYATGTPLSKIIQGYLNFSPSDVTHWALPSSVMAIRREDFLDLGGFYEGYTGHGYEDFDFMLRFTLRKRLLEPSLDLLVDRPYRAPLLAEGFRGALGTLCLPNLLKGNIAVHMFHSRDNAEGYYAQRTVNAQLFHERMANLLAELKASSSFPHVPPMVSDFYSECKLQAIPPTEYSAFFDARPRHLLVKKPWFKWVGRHVIRLPR